ncbi:alpha/beta hydrolase [Actinomadura kijaniata]|uniref:alpha/beta hydrolase n=1 Tax=Actinomadura kijaniata TaxID=46161 RepID=UPI000A06FE3C|nr:alpha/beta hydrolase [Actinomadura kijaniata]
MRDDYLRFLPEDLRPSPGLRPRSTWWRWRDLDLHVERVERPGAALRLLVLHGAGGHAGALWPLAGMAAELGLEVVVPDLPGYGRTRVPRPGRVRYPDWVGCVTDLVAAEKAADPRPLVLFGASMGGMLAYDVAARTGLAAAVVATCLLDPRRDAVRAAVGRHRSLVPATLPLMRLLAPVIDDLRVPIRLVARMNAIANDPALVRLVARDRLGGGSRVPLGFVRSYLESAPAIEPEEFTSCPVLLAHPGADRWTPIGLSRAFFDRIAAPKRLVVLDNAGHYPVEEPGVRRLADAFDLLRADIDHHDGESHVGRTERA